MLPPTTAGSRSIGALLPSGMALTVLGAKLSTRGERSPTVVHTETERVIIYDVWYSLGHNHRHQAGDRSNVR